MNMLSIWFLWCTMTQPDSLGTDYMTRAWDLIKVKEAWSLTQGDSTSLVGIVDMGFDFYHPDLQEVWIPGYFADGVYHPELYEVVAHGTSVASLIHALAPKCRILTASTGVIEHPLLRLKKQFFREHPDATMKDFQQELVRHAPELQQWSKRWQRYVARTTSEAIRYLVDHGVKVINLSVLLKSSEELEEAFQYAQEHDVVLVIGAGNNNREYTDYPGSSLDNVLVVGASTLQDERWVVTKKVEGTPITQGSNYGSRLSVVAPCESLIVAVPHEARFYQADDSPMGPFNDSLTGIRDTVAFGATSLATPIVTALVALVRSLRPDLSAAEVVVIIEKSAKDIDPPGWDPYTGYGRVDFERALNFAKHQGKK